MFLTNKDKLSLAIYVYIGIAIGPVIGLPYLIFTYISAQNILGIVIASIYLFFSIFSLFYGALVYFIFQHEKLSKYSHLLLILSILTLNIFAFILFFLLRFYVKSLSVENKEDVRYYKKIIIHNNIFYLTKVFIMLLFAISIFAFFGDLS